MVKCGVFLVSCLGPEEASQVLLDGTHWCWGAKTELAVMLMQGPAWQAWLGESPASTSNTDRRAKERWL